MLLKAVHLAAMQGDKDTLTAALRKNPSHVHAKDAHGKVSHNSRDFLTGITSTMLMSSKRSRRLGTSSRC